jgi:hypothetical protein
MTDRTIIAVVSDLVKSGLTVEQQILVNELVILTASLQAAYDLARERKEANKERMRRVRARAELCSTVQHTPSPFPPMINNSTPLSPSLNKSIKSVLAEPLFDEFWAVYPLKVGKGAARKAFRHACTRASADTIIDGVERYVLTKPDPKFTKHPATWLNSDCWLDEPSNVVQYQRPAYLEPQRPYREQREKHEN